MKTRRLHRWDLSPREAVRVQLDLRDRVIARGAVQNLRFVAGADVGVSADRKYIKAAVCVLSFPELEQVEQKTAEGKPAFPYVPGLLSFREAPLLLDCFKKLKTIPDVIIFDGQGIAHPRRFGLASHMGVLLDIPSVGCAKSPLYGDYKTPGKRKGDYKYIKDKNGVIGACLRTRENVKPLFVSVGNRLSLKSCIDIVIKCTPRYRLPEPIRRAHRLAGFM